MEAPDKIYLNKYMIRPGMLYPAQYPADTPEFEYIRKDALLELAKERYKAIENDNQLSELFKQGVLYELHRVIEKIESL